MSAHHHQDHNHGHSEDHGHAHSHAHHDHTHGSSERRLLIALVLTAGFMLVEVAAGFFSNSLALLADASHMLTDAVSLGLAFAAVRISRRPADARRSYGYDRMQVLAAFLNGATLIALSLWITVEAVLRVLNPVTVLAAPMLMVATIGFLINLICFGVLHGGAQDNLNMRGALAHVLSDLLGSVAAIVAALAILYCGWTQADPILSVLVALLILRNAWQITQQSAHVLLEGAPDEFDVGALETELPCAIVGVRNVHHVHAWMLSPEKPMLTLHVCIEPDADADILMRQINTHLQKHHKIVHATIQIERGDCAEPHH